MASTKDAGQMARPRVKARVIAGGSLAAGLAVLASADLRSIPTREAMREDPDDVVRLKVVNALLRLRGGARQKEL